ncbi:MAG: hypothetical protein U0271_18295 [Polyangiaceae bacterium]
MSELRLGKLSLEEHAELRARLRYRQTGQAVSFDVFGVDLDGFRLADELWTKRLDDQLASGESAELEGWYRVFDSVRDELEFALRSAMGISNRVAGGAAGPGSMAVSTPPATVARPQLSPTADSDTHVVAPPQIGLISTPSAPLQGSADLSTVPTGTALSPGAAGGEPSARTIQGLTLEVYAKLAAELSAYPSRRAEVFQRYGVDESAFGRIATAWRRVIANEGLSVEYMGIFARHHASLTGG